MLIKPCYITFCLVTEAIFVWYYLCMKEDKLIGIKMLIFYLLTLNQAFKVSRSLGSRY